MRISFSFAIRILFLVLTSSVTCFSQTDPKNVPKPPATELKKLEQFFGKYVFNPDYAGLKWSGTLEVKPAVKGWYVERIILVKAEGIDREFRSMITYDPALKHYRIWRFETMPPMVKNEGAGRFEGGEFIEEYELDESSGSKEILRNRVTMPSKNEMRIITEIQDAKGKVVQIGEGTAKRGG